MSIYKNFTLPDGPSRATEKEPLEAVKAKLLDMLSLAELERTLESVKGRSNASLRQELEAADKEDQIRNRGGMSKAELAQKDAGMREATKMLGMSTQAMRMRMGMSLADAAALFQITEEELVEHEAGLMLPPFAGAMAFGKHYDDWLSLRDVSGPGH